MEIDITRLVSPKLNLRNYSASQAEIGDNAGRITWCNSVGLARDGMVFVSTEDEKEKARRYFSTFGAWDKEEIAAWSDDELNALIIQLVAGDLRDYFDAKKRTRAEFKRWEENQGGRIYRSDRKYFYYLGE